MPKSTILETEKRLIVDFTKWLIHEFFPRLHYKLFDFP